MATLNALPVELLTEIFALVIMPWTGWYRRWKAKYGLIAVCRFWRDIMYTTLPYWTVISIPRGVSAEYLDFCVRRASRGYVDIWMDCSPPHMRSSISPKRIAPCPMPAFQDMLRRYLRPAFHRVQKLHIAGRVASDFAVCIEELSTYNTLAVCSAYLGYTGDKTFSTPPKALFHTATRLTQLMCHDVPLSVGDGRWSTLTYLDIAGRRRPFRVDWPDLRSALGHAGQLKKLKLDDVVCDNLTPDDVPITIPLMDTILFTCGDVQALDVLSMLDTPSLESCRFDLLESAEQHPFRGMRTVGLARTCDVRLVPANAHQLGWVFNLMPRVEQLDLRRCEFIDWADLQDALVAMDGKMSALRRVLLAGSCSDSEAGTVLASLAVATGGMEGCVEVYPCRTDLTFYISHAIAATVV